MAVTEVTHEGWGTRIGKSIKGVLFGLVLIVAAGALLFWNEGDAVRNTQTLQEGRGSTVEADPARVDPALEGRLVHLTGRAETDEVLSDPTFKVRVRALRLRRVVEMFQWKENKRTRTEKKLGGGTRRVTTYTYSTTWSPRLIDSSRFREPGHENPASMPWKSRSLQARTVRLGAYRLPESLVRKMDNFAAIPPTEEMLAGAADAERLRPKGDALYLANETGRQVGGARIGDVRIRFAQVPPGEVSVISRQVGDTFEPYVSRAGKPIHMLAVGVRSMEEMYGRMEKANMLRRWGLRLAGFVVMLIGFCLLFAPLSVLADVVPILGSLVGAGTFLVSLLLSAVVSLVVIAVAWLFYRPLLAVGLIAAAVVVLLILLRRRGKKQLPAPAGGTHPPAAPPPPPPAG